jgi:hypothetical protein
MKMKKILLLAKYDFAEKYKSGVLKHLAMFYISIIISIFFFSDIIVDMNSVQIKLVSIMFSVLSFIIVLTSTMINLHRTEFESGYFENLLSISSGYTISAAKFTFLSILSLIIMVFCLPIMLFLYNVDFGYAYIIFISSILLLILSNAFIVLVESICNYFRGNWYILSSIINLFIIPPMIITSIILHKIQTDIIFTTKMFSVLLLIDFILIPVAVYFAGYLNDNSYNLS